VVELPAVLRFQASSSDGVATQLPGKRIRKLEAMTAHSPITATRLCAMSRPCRKSSSFRYAGTPNWRYVATAAARPHDSQRRRSPGANLSGTISANG
jgi:hypothetical protein